MKVCVASEGPSIDSPVSNYFGQAPYFVCKDTSTGSIEVLESPSRTKPMAGTEVARWLVSQGVSKVIGKGIGPRVGAVLSSSGVEATTTGASTVREVLSGNPSPGSNPQVDLSTALEGLKPTITYIGPIPVIVPRFMVYRP